MGCSLVPSFGKHSLDYRGILNLAWFSLVTQARSLVPSFGKHWLVYRGML